MQKWIIPKSVLNHIYDEHKDLVETLKIRSIMELREAIANILQNPDKTHVDRFKNNVKYYLKRINNLWVNIILEDNTVKTAYLIGSKSYRKFKEKRWQ